LVRSDNVAGYGGLRATGVSPCDNAAKFLSKSKNRTELTIIIIMIIDCVVNVTKSRWTGSGSN
jgi:hypothetical protein